MKSRKTRVFRIDGTDYRFNSQAFRSYIDSITGKAGGRTKEELYAILETECGTSPDALKNWMYGKNGPSDILIIRRVADAVGIDDWMILLKKVCDKNDTDISGKEKNMNGLTDRQKDAAKRVYDVLVWFLEEYSNSDGFRCWNEMLGEDEIFGVITEMKDKVSLVINQEYFDLHDNDIYSEFCEFSAEDLPDVYPAYIRDDANTDYIRRIWHEYEQAMLRLNDIIERYI